jgi:hypothetical protein
MASKLKEKNVRASFPDRLLASTKAWQKLQEPSLRNRAIMLKAVSAGYYDKNAKKARSHPINLIERGMSILVPYLVMNDPNILITTKSKKYKPFAQTTELAFNHLMREIKFAKLSLRPVVRDAMFGLGIMKTGIMKSHEVEIHGHLHAIGQVYADPIDLIDYIGDPTALSFEAFEYEGNFYRMSAEAAREMYPKHADCFGSSYTAHGRNEQYNPEKLVKGEDYGAMAGEYSSLRETVYLADYWLPDESVILTIEPNSGKILRTTEAETPEGGPYDKLYFKDFPGTALPIPPVWYWLDMDTALNVIVNKMRKQAESQKTVLAYEGDAADDAERLASAGDTGTVKVSNVQGLKNVEWPGIDPQHYQWIQYLDQQFSSQGNNLYTLGGQNSQADTLGQEQMLMANASKAVDDMTNSVYEFTQSVSKKAVFHFWSDPLISIPQIKRIQGYGDIEVVFDRAARDGEFWDYEFKIEPYSMQRLSPSVEFQRTLSLLTQWIIPTMQNAAQQGAVPNIPRATAHLAKMAGLRGFDNWYDTAVPNIGAEMNPYSPTQGKPKNKDVQDGRTGVNPNSNVANSRQKNDSDGKSV